MIIFKKYNKDINTSLIFKGLVHILQHCFISIYVFIFYEHKKI